LTDKSFRSPAEIRRRLGLPVIGHIPQIRIDTPADVNAPGGLDPVLAAALRPKSVEAEAYRGLRTQLYFSTQGRGHQVVQVTSPNPGDGKSTLAANLAVSIAQSGKRVVLIDCDFRKPRVHKIFDLPSTGEVGLAGVIAGEAPIQAAVRPSGLPNLDLLPCGPRPANPAELLTSPQFQHALDEVRKAYDFVIVDTPPLLAVSDPSVVASRVDGVLLTFRMTKKVRPAAERAREQLAALGANVLGVVVNGWASGGRGYYDYNYGSSYGYRYKDYEYADEYADDPSYHGGEAAPLPAKG
jgi:succinoglycan biosynthesis transport protein ExoP